MAESTHAGAARPAEPPAGGARAGLGGPQVSLARRLVALVIDWLLCLAASGVLGSPYRSPWLAPLVLVGVYTFFVGLFGQTPGMRLTRIRCVSVRDGGPLGLGRAFLRAVLLATLVPVLVMDREQRGMHDRLVDSVMVPARPPAPGRG